MPNELKPCPFCGCKCIIAEIDHLNDVFCIYCEECPAKIELSFVDAKLGKGDFISFYEATSIINELTDKWNRRADNGNER